MINYYFGLPGCGKTTHLVATAIKENSRINSGKSKYKRILSNVRFSVPEGQVSNCYLFDNDDFGFYDMADSLILFDESQMKFDNRDFGKMKREVRDFLMLHRHYRCNIYFYNQCASSIDVKIRNITNNMYYMRRSLITGKTIIRRVKPTLHIPKKPKHDQLVTAENGEIIMRYYLSGFFEHLITKLFIEPPLILKRYYGYFDSFEAPPLPVKSYELLE